MKKFVGAVLAVLFSATLVAAQNEAQIAFDEKTYDFGTFPEEKGKVTHEFTFTNTGSAPLVLQKVQASCGCTTPDWPKEPIAPGKTGKITVTYAATGRPGAFNKSITVFSNSKSGNEVLLIKGEVTPKSKSPETMYPYPLDNELLTNKREIKFASMKNNETKTELFTLFNNNTTPVELKCNTHGSKFISARESSLKLGAKESGQFTLNINGKGAPELGPVQDYFVIENASGASSGNKGRINVSTTVIENFDNMTQEEWKNAPVAELSSVLVVLDQSAKKGKINVTNTGKSILKIRKVALDNTEFILSGGKESLKPGAVATYTIAAKNEKNIAGKVTGNITFIFNDPNAPIRTAKIVADF